MTPDRPGDRPRHFTPSELDGVSDLAPEDLAAEHRLARELEAAADRSTVRQSDDFADRVMRAVAAEPVPAPIRAAGAAVRHRSLAALLGSIRDAWRVAMGAGFPIAARAQAMALVLVVAVFAAGSGIATAGALGVFNDHPATVGPSPSVPPADAATPDLSPIPQPTDGSLDPSASATPEASDASESPSSEPQETAEPRETPKSSGGTSGGSGDGGSGSSGTPKATATPRPTGTPEPTSTAEPSDPPEATAGS